MLNGSHVILYAKDADRTRAFFRDTLGLAHVSAGEGWLIFALPPAELGIHPDATGGRHQFFLMCDDVERTRAELTAKGVRFTQPVTDQGWGIMTAFDVPGMGELWMYQPRHPKPPQQAPGAARAPRRVARPKKPAGRKGRPAPKAKRAGGPKKRAPATGGRRR